MDVETRMPLQPAFYLGMLMGRIVVSDQMQIEMARCRPVQLVQELNELLMTMAVRALGNDRTIQNVQGGKQGCRPVPAIIVRLSGRLTRGHW